MIYLIYGSDKDTTRKKSSDLIASLQKKKPDAAFFSLNEENFSTSAAEEYIASQGLFEQKYIVFIDSVLSTKDTKKDGTDAKESNASKERKEELLKMLKEMGGSQNIFIFREGDLDKKTLPVFEKNAEKLEEHSFTKEEKLSKKKMPFNIFSLGDALGRRDKKSLWVLYQEAKDAGTEDEQIAGTLFWQIKNMLLVQSSASAEEAGIHPFVFSKTKSFAKNYTDAELREISSKLIHLYHDARRGIHDLNNALERFTLEL